MRENGNPSWGPDSDPDELATIQRTAIVVWSLAHGRSLSTSDVARICNITQTGAYLLLNKIALVLPIYTDTDHKTYIWSRVPDDL